jgi:hypothetical protein
MVRYTLHQYKDDNKPKNETINLSFSIIRLTCFEWSTALYDFFWPDTTPPSDLTILYVVTTMSRLANLKKSCIKIQSTYELHEVRSILGGGCSGCGTLRYNSWNHIVQKIITIYRLYHRLYWELDSTVSIATHYRLDGPGIESNGGELFCTCPDQPWVPPSLL